MNSIPNRISRAILIGMSIICCLSNRAICEHIDSVSQSEQFGTPGSRKAVSETNFGLDYLVQNVRTANQSKYRFIKPLLLSHGEKAIDPIIDLLISSDERTKLRAIELMGLFKYGDERIIPLLDMGMNQQDQDQKFHSAYANALAQKGERALSVKDSIENLFKSTHDSFIRQKAGFILSHMGREGQMVLINALINNKDAIRNEAYWRLVAANYSERYRGDLSDLLIEQREAHPNKKVRDQIQKVIAKRNNKGLEK